MNTIKNIWHILASLLFIIFCSCASASSFTSDYNQKSDLYYYGKTSGNINQHFMCYLNVVDSTFKFEYKTTLDFVHSAGIGHWHSIGNNIILDFDIEPDVSRILEGWLYRDKMFFEYKNHKLFFKKHIDSSGNTLYPNAELEEITEQQFKKSSSFYFPQ